MTNDRAVTRTQRDLKAGDRMTMWDLALLANMGVGEVKRSLIAEGLLAEDDLLSVDDLPEGVDTIWGGDIENTSAHKYILEDSDEMVGGIRQRDEGLTEKGKALIGVRLWALDAASAKAWLRRRGVPLNLLPADVDLSHASDIKKLLRVSSPKNANIRTRLVFGYSAKKLANKAGLERKWLRRFLDDQRVPCDILALYGLAESLGYEFNTFLGLAAEAILSTTSGSQQET